MTSPKNGRKTFSQLSQLVHGRGNGWAIQITKPRSKETALDSGKSARGPINSLRQFKVQWVEPLALGRCSVTVMAVTPQRALASVGGNNGYIPPG